ncbi:hypothetical protein LC55x_0077 [Lysobacter capsici]|nr:hypothetical protein LC55x_0077 [Lysobacter capsici]
MPGGDRFFDGRRRPRAPWTTVPAQFAANGRAVGTQRRGLSPALHSLTPRYKTLSRAGGGDREIRARGVVFSTLRCAANECRFTIGRKITE